MTDDQIFKNAPEIIFITPPEKPGKITGGRFAAVLGLNPFKTPFQAWCDMSMTYDQMKHKDTPNRLAGRLLEPKIAEYLKTIYNLRIRSPSEITGKPLIDRIAVDMFPDNQVFGGAWDYIGDGFIVEIKTTGSQSFVVPQYYMLQSALYAYLCGFDTVYISTTVLQSDDYPIKTQFGWDCKPIDDFTVSEQNTRVYIFNISSEFPMFEKLYINRAINFWNQHVKTGRSPKYNIKADRHYLQMLSAHATY